jgi:hypothetical protein
MGQAIRNLTLFRHSLHAEWGHGIIVEENADRVYLHFEHGGRRAFVNAARYREHLVGVELPPSEAAAVRSELKKHLPKPTKATSRRKVSSPLEEDDHDEEAVAS